MSLHLLPRSLRSLQPFSQPTTITNLLHPTQPTHRALLTCSPPRLARQPTKPALGALPSHSAHPPTANDTNREQKYYAPLTGAFTRLKIFSVSSLVLTSGLLLYISVVPRPDVGDDQAALMLSIAIGTSAFSTGTIAYFARPYVSALRILPPSQALGMHARGPALQLQTRTLLLRKRQTQIHDAVYLCRATRPLATWSLDPEYIARQLLPRTGSEVEGMEQELAVTYDVKGNVKGAWHAIWMTNSAGELVPAVESVGSSEQSVFDHHMFRI